MKINILACCLLLSAYAANAQGNADQEGIRELIENQTGDIDNIQRAQWQVYNVSKGNEKHGAVNKLKEYLNTIGGDLDLEKKIQVVELANRCRAAYFRDKSRLLVPTHFYSDYRAYSPYPSHYAAATSLPKLFIIDKRTQTFGAYEYGKLCHWGLVSSGKSDGATPPGRYNFNWKTYFKLSNAAPEGVEWRLFWVYNFYSKIGLHVHQYALPLGNPASHGCVRVAKPDAQWNYEWANGWVKKGGNVVRNGTPVMVINSNPPDNKSAHWAIGEGGTVSSLVDLPAHLEDVPLHAPETKMAAWNSGW